MEGEVIVQMYFIEAAVGEMYTHWSRALLVYLYRLGINQFRPHMKARLFVLCYLLVQ